jgi:hypothetical protein
MAPGCGASSSSSFNEVLPGRKTRAVNKYSLAIAGAYPGARPGSTAKLQGESQESASRSKGAALMTKTLARRGTFNNSSKL